MVFYWIISYGVGVLAYPHSPQHAPFIEAWVDAQALSLASQVETPSDTCREWLINIESLTDRLMQQCQDFSVAVLAQDSNVSGVAIAADELALVDHNDDNSTQLVIREVLLQGDGQPWVFARSIFPVALTQDALHELGNQPLGKLLFNDPRFQRQPFMLAFMLPDDPFVQHLLAQKVISAQALELHLRKHAGIWARRSVFTYLEHHILVNEVFLPGAPAYA
jgi:chorismate--pyruvate lyase